MTLIANTNALARIVALAAVLVGILAAGFGTAQAATTKSEGFEKSHANLRFHHFGTGGGQLIVNRNPVPILNPNTSRTGFGHAYVWAQNAGSWSAVDRTFSMLPEDRWCSASVYVHPMGGTRRVGLKVFTPAGRTLSAVAATVSGSTYQVVRLPVFGAGVSTMVARVVVTSATGRTDAIRVDDLTVGCDFLT